MQYTLSFVWQQFPGTQDGTWVKKKFPGTQASCTTPSTSSTAHQLLPFADWQKCRTKVGLIIGGYHQHIEEVALQLGSNELQINLDPF